MGELAIRVSGLGKQYRLGARQERYSTLRDQVRKWASAPLRTLLRRAKRNEKRPPFWALKDVSFEVNRGEVVGVIGRNGAGKSTLLKVLSRITEPTEGEVDVHGRVGSLLEVGTGFHPELTGRENVYLNGAILGMRRAEIARKFDEIVAFAEVEKFIDTPVKHYSSGMYTRLAFAVAAHLEPEILIVDEVLAVGDATYQKRCIDRMSELARSGNTILFVSHNMQLIPRLCRRAVLLQTGRVARVGEASAVVDGYLSAMVGDARDFDLSAKPRQGDGRARFQRGCLVDSDGRETSRFLSGTDFTVRMEVERTGPASDVALAVILHQVHGERFITSWTREGNFPVALTPGRNVFECRFRRVSLRPGHTVAVGLWMSDGEVLDFVETALVVDVVGDERHERFSQNSDQGVVLCDYSWCKTS